MRGGMMRRRPLTTWCSPTIVIPGAIIRIHPRFNEPAVIARDRMPKYLSLTERTKLPSAV